jgi:hypothetical protein
MTDERPTLRPVTLSRLIEVTDLCAEKPTTTVTIEEALDVTHARAREATLEARRIGVVTATDETYSVTDRGTRFLAAVKESRWEQVSNYLETGSTHYRTYLDVLREQGPASQEEVLERLEDVEQDSGRTYNQTSVDVLSDWAERLGVVQRNAFSGMLYTPEQESPDDQFVQHLLSVYDEIDSTTGVGLRRQYVPIPELREYTCEQARLQRADFDEGLVDLTEGNIGRLDLLGAPIDTDAKSAPYGIRRIQRTEDDGLVTTTQSSEFTMRGIEFNGKKYYYFVVYDRDLSLPNS